MSWPGERQRHSMSGRGVTTTPRLNNGTVLEVFHEETMDRVGYFDMVPTIQEYPNLYDEYYHDLKNTITLSYVEIYEPHRNKGLLVDIIEKIVADNRQIHDGIFLRVDPNSEIPFDVLVNIYKKLGFEVYLDWGQDEFYMLKRWREDT